MNNPSGNKLEKLVFGMFDQMVEGSDKYITEQGSTWLIFTEDKRWVVEFTKDKTLWFNYNLFQSELDLVSQDCTQERDLIKNWFESRFLGIKPVEDTIQNGVKNTFKSRIDWTKQVEDAIQNGVKDTQCDERSYSEWVEDTIQNGVRHTEVDGMRIMSGVKDAIQNGVKDTKKSHWIKSIEAEDIIENGISDVKHSYDFEEIVVKDIIEDSYNHKGRVEGVIRNTVKDGI